MKWNLLLISLFFFGINLYFHLFLFALPDWWVQGVWEAFRMVDSAQTEGVPFIFLITVILTAGCATLRWLADSVEASGLGDGITLLITLNIVSGKAQSFEAAFKLRLSSCRPDQTTDNNGHCL